MPLCHASACHPHNIILKQIVIGRAVALWIILHRCQEKCAHILDFCLMWTVQKNCGHSSADQSQTLKSSFRLRKHSCRCYGSTQSRKRWVGARSLTVCVRVWAFLFLTMAAGWSFEHRCAIYQPLEPWYTFRANCVGLLIRRRIEEHHIRYGNKWHRRMMHTSLTFLVRFLNGQCMHCMPIKLLIRCLEQIPFALSCGYITTHLVISYHKQSNTFKIIDWTLSIR